MRANCHFVRLGGPSSLPANAHPRGEVLSPPTKKQLKKISKLQNPKLGGSALGMQLMLRQQDLWEEHCPGSHVFLPLLPVGSCGTHVLSLGLGLPIHGEMGAAAIPRVTLTSHCLLYTIE